jgi:Transposase DNA-binding/Transposase DDE domain
MAPIGFKDARLRDRLAKMSDKMAEAPGLSFPQMFEDPADLEACYRFFGNVKVTTEAILAPHYAEVAERVSALRDVLVVHDTTRFSFGEDSHRRGLGRYSKTEDTFFAHVSLVLSSQGYRRPLGVASLWTWVRKEKTGDEHTRWFANVERAVERIGHGNAIHLMDREGDDYVLFFQLIQKGERFVIRATHNRLLLNRRDGQKLRDVTLSLEREVERAILISRRNDKATLPGSKGKHPARNARLASLAIGATTVELRRPKVHPRDKNKKRPHDLPASIKVNIVRVWESDPPPNEPPVEWHLITTEPITTSAEIERIVDNYRARWAIEEYFKALKTGCSMEKRQLLDYESLCNALATFVPIAYKMLALRSAARDTPDETQSLALGADEVEVLRTRKPKMISVSPTSRELLLAVASLGGHIKRNGEPGWLTIMRGMEKLLVLTEGWRLAKLQQSRDQS